MHNRLSHGMGGLVLIVALAACSSAPASPPGVASPSVTTPGDPPGPSISTATSAPPSPSSPLGGGLLMVFQLDGRTPETVTTTSVYTLDLGSGETVGLGSLPVNRDTCCPTEARYAADRSRAFLIAARYAGIVDVAKRNVAPIPRKVAGLYGAVSRQGDRIAWVDEVTGTAETIVITDAASGKNLRRLDLPTGAWFTEGILAWSPDDTSVVLQAEIPLKEAQTRPDPSIVLARFPAPIIACCTVDHGITANHLLVVPVDGAPIHDLADMAAEVASDLAAPAPTPPPGFVGGPGRVTRRYGDFVWSPDGRTIAVSDWACGPGWRSREPQHPPCVTKLRTVDVATGAQSILVDGSARMGSLSWSPDGQQLAFIRESGPDGADAPGLYVIDRGGGTPSRLTDAETWATGWSPDGSWIVFARINPAAPQGTDRIDMWATPLAGGAPRLVAEHAVAGW